MKSPPALSSELAEALQGLRGHLKQVFLFSVVTNVLVLAPTGYMLEVYDRVVGSRSHHTLLMLTGLVLAAFVLLELLEWVRTQILFRAGLHLDKQLNARIFDAIFRAQLAGTQGGAKGWRDLRTIREFFSGQAILALMDAPIALLLLGLIYAIHPLLGLAALVGTLAQAAVAYRTEIKTHKRLTEANLVAQQAQAQVDNGLRNTEVLHAMGMLGDMRHKWMERQQKLLELQAEASDISGRNTALSKFLQLTLSSLLLGLAAWFTLRNELSHGGSMMIVASILGGRAVAPLATLIAQWKSVVGARDAYARLQALLSNVPARQPGMPLPAPSGPLTVEAVVASPPGNSTPVIRGMSFAVPPAKTVAIIGPSASGKSSLARLLVGLWPASSGKVRLGNADVFAWNKAELGPHIGYLPQEVELFDGSFAENIARFGEVDPEQVEAAAKVVGLDGMIRALPDGYDTPIGEDGRLLSGGQRQRVALARAVYGCPRLVVLDEPNASLDDAGEEALLHTLEWLKEQGATTLVITHRRTLLPVIDLLLVVRDGTVQGYGPRDEILAAMSRPPQTSSPAPLGAQVSR